MTQHKHKISIGKMLLALGVLSTTGASLATPAFADETTASNSFSSTATVADPPTHYGPTDATPQATNYADNEYKVCVNHYSETIYYVQANESCESGYQEAENTSGLYTFEIPDDKPIVCVNNTPAEILEGTISVSFQRVVYATTVEDTMFPYYRDHCGTNSHEIYLPRVTFLHNFSECVIENYNAANTTTLSTLTDAQIAQIETLECHYDSAYYIHSLDKLTGLKELSVANVQNEALDFSANQNLSALYLHGPKIKSVNVSGNSKLSDLNLQNTSVSTVDLSKNTNLGLLTIDNTPLSGIDLSKNTKLFWLQIRNAGISKLDVSMLPELTQIYVEGNNLSELDLSKNSKLSVVSAYENKLSKITFGDKAKSEEGLGSVDLSNNNLEYVDLSQVIDEPDKAPYSYFVLYGNKNLKIVAVPAAWEGKYTEEQIRKMLSLDENQKDVIIQFGKLKVPNTGIGAIFETAKYAAIVALPAILAFFIIGKNAVKIQRSKVKFSR